MLVHIPMSNMKHTYMQVGNFFLSDNETHIPRFFSTFHFVLCFKFKREVRVNYEYEMVCLFM